MQTVWLQNSWKIVKGTELWCKLARVLQNFLTERNQRKQSEWRLKSKKGLRNILLNSFKPELFPQSTVGKMKFRVRKDIKSYEPVGARHRYAWKITSTVSLAWWTVTSKNSRKQPRNGKHKNTKGARNKALKQDAERRKAAKIPFPAANGRGHIGVLKKLRNIYWHLLVNVGREKGRQVSLRGNHPLIGWWRPETWRAGEMKLGGFR